jgi:alpha-1,3-rhamnosyltransferase
MSTAHDVAVLVPSYNHAPYIAECLRSIFAQTHSPSRLLVIDDGSRDASVEVIERTLKDCPFPAELIARQNRGLCRTLNEGLSRTSGEYFAYLGSDDLWTPVRLAAGLAALAPRPEAVLAYSPCYIIDQSGRIVGNSRDWQKYVDGNVLPALLSAESIPPSPTMLYRREPLSRVGWNEQSRLEDYENFLRLATLGPFAFVPEPTGYWREHASNTSKDVEMVLGAYLEAQGRLAPELGLDRATLRRAQAQVRYRYADYFLAAGQRGRAVQMTLRNLRGAPSPTMALRRLVRLGMPASVLRRRTEMLRARATARYASTSPD